MSAGRSETAVARADDESALDHLAVADQLISTIARIRRAGRRQGRPSELRELTGAQLELLRLVGRQPGVSVAVAARELRLAANTVSTLVGRLTDAGLLVRSVSDSDRRIAMLDLSAGIREQIDAWRDRRVVSLAAAVGDLGADEQRGFADAVALVERVAGLLEQRAEQ